MTYKIQWCNGPVRDGFKTYDDAVAYLLEPDEPELFIGHEGDTRCDLTDGGDRTLFWADAESADGDDGSEAIGEIRRG